MQFPKNFEPDKLLKLTPAQRFQRLENTKNLSRLSEEDRAMLIGAIHESGPIFDSSGLTADDPITLAMEEIIFSAKGREACLKAVAEGLPALAGIERLIIAEVGDRYGPTNSATNWAGWFVGQLMRSLNYEPAGSKSMPKGSVAKTSTFWTQKQRR